MSPKCLLRKCQRDTATCRCRRCSRLMHDWQSSQVSELRSELRGVTSQGKMRYERLVRHQERCAACGAVRDRTKSQVIDL